MAPQVPKVSEDLLRLMLPYARLGIANWRQVPAHLRQTATTMPWGPRISDRLRETEYMLQATGKAQASLIPMPTVPSKPGYSQAFFAFNAKPSGNRLIIGFEVVLLLAGKRELAFRFEPAHPQGTHTYDHVQMSQKILGRSIRLAETWIPTKYPAPPLPSSDPLELFLCMATAVHGYKDGARRIIKEVFQREGRATEAEPYLTRLKNLLKN